MGRYETGIAVAIPAMNEVGRIGSCLQSLAQQLDAPPFSVLVLVNNSTDATAAVARAWQAKLRGLHVDQVHLPWDQAHAGGARRLAMEKAAGLCLQPNTLLTTDADTILPPHWIMANVTALEKGADAVAGRAIIDPIEACAIPRNLHELDALERSYAALLDELAFLIEPDPHDPWPRHDEHSGASIAVRADIWRAVGGIPLQRSGEDRAFFARMRAVGARIRHAPDIAVIVSGRLNGRAEGGMADTIRHRIHSPPQWLDDRLEPVSDFVQRLRGERIVSPTRRVAFADLADQMKQAISLRDQLLIGQIVDACPSGLRLNA